MESEKLVYYAVYLIDSELPVAMFMELNSAELACNGFFANWLDKEIRTVNFWNIASPLFRDRTTHLKYIKKTQDLFNPLNN